MPMGKGPLRIAIEDFLEGFHFGDRFKDWMSKEGQSQKDGSLGNSWHVIMSQLGMDADLPPIVSKDSPHLVLGAAALIPMLLGAVIGLGFSFISVLIQPVALLAQYRVNQKFPAYRINPSQLAQLLKLFPEKSADWLSQMADLGVDEKTLNGLQALNRQYLNALQYVTLWRRGQLSEAELENKLTQLMIFDTDIERLKQVTEVIPTPNDLILMAVREAFDDSFSSKFQHDENLPPDFVEWAKKQGLSEEWSKRYWRAHWQLPSPSQVFDMLHRLRPGMSENTVQSEDVDFYLRAADYSPFWRERLKEISYSPFTRVDVRRMYKTGVLSESEVKDAYRDLGYDEKRSQALTEFTIAYEAEEETGIVRSSVLSAYGDGMIDRPTAETMLRDGGYDETTVKFYLDNVDFKDALAVRQLKLSNIKKRYVEGLIDESAVNGEINMLDLPSERVTAMLELWTTERENQTALLTITQMETLLERKIVTEEDYKRVAKRRGYSDESIKWTLERIALEAASQAQKDAEKAEADNERLQKSKTSSQYQKDKSEIDLDIAQAKAEITDIDVALHGDVSVEDAASLTIRKDELKVFIAQLNVAKAQLKFDIQTSLDKLVG